MECSLTSLESTESKTETWEPDTLVTHPTLTISMPDSLFPIYALTQLPTLNSLASSHIFICSVRSWEGRWTSASSTVKLTTFPNSPRNAPQRTLTQLSSIIFADSIRLRVFTSVSSHNTSQPRKLSSSFPVGIASNSSQIYISFFERTRYPWEEYSFFWKMKFLFPCFLHTESSPRDALTLSTLKSWVGRVEASSPRLKSRCGSNQRSRRLLPVSPTTKAKSPWYCHNFLVCPQSRTHPWSCGWGAGSMHKTLSLLLSATIRNWEELSSSIPDAMRAMSCNVLALTKICPGTAQRAKAARHGPAWLGSRRVFSITRNTAISSWPTYFRVNNVSEGSK